MKIQQLRYFIEVCNCQTITEAAAKLYVSQPSITAALRELEKDLGVNLFRRVNKKLYITQEGEHLLYKANLIVRDIDILEEELKSMSVSNRKIRLGLPAQSGSYLMPILLKDFLNQYPLINLEILELSSNELRELIEKDEIDLAIMIDNRINTNIFKVKKIFESQICFVTSIKSKFVNHPFIEIDQLMNEKLVLLEKNYSATKLITELFSSQDITPDILMMTSHLNTVKNLVKNNVVSSFLLRESVAYDEDCIAIPIKDNMKVNVSVVTKKDKIETRNVRDLINFLVNSNL